MTISRMLAIAFLFATVTSALAEDPKPLDEVFISGMEVSLRGEVLGFRGTCLEMRTERAVVRIETRFLRCVRFGGASALVFEENFPGTEVGPRWEKKSGKWTVKDGVATGIPDQDCAVLELREKIPGDAVLDLDAAIHSKNPRGGLHVSFGGQHWFLYPRWSGIYPPYQEIDGRDLWARAQDGEYSFEGHFRFARTGTHFEFTIDGKPFHHVESTPPEALEGKLVLCAAHGAEVRYRNIRVEATSGAAIVPPAEYKATTEIQVWLAGGRKVTGSMGDASPEDLALTVHADGEEIPLKAITCIVFPPREATVAEFELDAVQQARLEAWATQLGDEEYGKRDEASRQLVEMGSLAFSVVSRAATSPDPEIAARAKLIVERLKPGGK